MGVVEEEEVRSSYEVGLEGRAVLEDQEDQAGKAVAVHPLAAASQPSLPRVALTSHSMPRT